MNDKRQQEATRLDDALKKKGAERHAPELRPFVEIADALAKDASAPVPPRDPNTTKNQRITLMNMANASSKTPAPVQKPTPVQNPAPAPIEKAPRRFPLWIGGAAVAMAVVVLAFVSLKGPGANVFAPSMESASIARLFIPEAHAGDAFTLIAESQDATGAAVDTSFKVTSKVDMSADVLKQHLVIVPPTLVTVDDIGNNEFRVTPTKTLAPGEVYRLALNTTVKRDDGPLTEREFSWAVQTKDVFRVVSSVPGNQAVGVPVETGIEVTMSQVGWSDIAPFFSITPSVEGNFEVHGRSLAFVPSKPLAYGQIYTVTYKKGWGVSGSDRILDEDIVFSFETAPKEDIRKVLRLDTQDSFVETAPKKDAFVNVYGPGDKITGGKVTVTGFALSNADAKDFLKKLYAIPWWSDIARSQTDVYTASAKTQSFQLAATVEEKDYTTFVRVPGVEAGVYLVRLEPASLPGMTSEPSWFVLQSTNVATYDISDAKSTVLWVMNLETQQPLTGATVSLAGVSASTGNDGIARVATPSNIASTTTNAVEIAEVTAGSLSAIVPLERNTAIPFDFKFRPQSDAHDSTWGYIFADRPLYRLNDKLTFFGLSQDRDTQRPTSGLTVELRRSGYLDFFSYHEKVYASTPVTADETGAFHGTLAWDTLAPGYYTVSLLRDGQEVTSRSIELRDFVKPIFSIDVIPAKASIYAGDAVDGQIKASLFDGSPAVREQIQVTFNGQSIDVTTDESGLATYHFTTDHANCDLTTTYSYCNSVSPIFVYATPHNGEEATIQGSTIINVWAARLTLDMESQFSGTDAKLTFHVHRVDLTKAQDVAQQPASGAAVHGKIFEQEWVKKETGSYYDPIEKKSVPQYSYDLVEHEVGSVNVTTGADGSAVFTQSTKADKAYRVAVAVTDETNATDGHSFTIARGWVDTGAGDSAARLVPNDAEKDLTGYTVGDTVGVHFTKGNAAVPDASTPSYLYVEAQRGIRNASVTNKASYSFTYREELVPNMTLYAVTFGPTGFVETSYYANFDEKGKALDVTVTPDAASYAPGAKVTANVDVRSKDGAPVSNARVIVAAVDEALFAAAYGGIDEMPLQSLYLGVNDGILLTRSSHAALNEKAGSGGAEMGGGGGETIRRNFKDTAAVETLTTDASGHATMSFTAPDNITSWRLTSVALTGDRRAGAARSKAVVTKPVFVDAVIPQTFLATDAPVLKLRAFGSGLTSGEELTFTVNAPTLGLTNEMVKGTAGAPVTVGIQHLTPGNHTMVIKVTSGHGSDAIERHLTVLTSRFTHDESSVTELAPGVALPDPGESPEVIVSLLPLGRSRYLNRVESLAYPLSARLEAKAASNIANRLLKDAYGKSDAPAAQPLLSYQQADSGIGMLPYGSSDVALSAKMAALDPQDIDRSALANYFWKITDNAKVSREEGVQALLGLAALGEPVLTRVQTLANSTDLNWRERLALIRALDAAGDRERARAMLQAILKDAVTTDGLTHLAVAEDQRSILEATAEAAPLAAKMELPEATGLEAYLSANWESDTITDLDRAAYLAEAVPKLVPGDATVTYAINGKESSVKLVDGWGEPLTLTKAEAASFRVISVDGPVAASFTRRVGGRMAVSPDVTLMRSYAVDGESLDQLTEGKTVTITLSPTWNQKSQDGCYVIRDRLPSGLVPFVPVASYSSWTNYPYDVTDSEVSFIRCKDSVEKDVRYTARVVSRGTYTAEAASLQSMDAPSVAALSTDTTITIK
ncbi:MAG: alpha-2-macroglobulin family protein [Patescibacteria group bacterium]